MWLSKRRSEVAFLKPLTSPGTAVLFSFHLESLCLWLSRNIFECEVISVVDGMADASGSYDPESVFIAGEERIRTQLGRILNHPEPTVRELSELEEMFPDS